MKQLRNIVTGILILIGGMLPIMVSAQKPVEGDTTTVLQQKIIMGKDTINQEANQIDIKGIAFGHIGDSYEWHITNMGKTSIRIPLPITVYSETSGWHALLSSRLEENDGKYEGFYIAPTGSRYEGKIVERNTVGEEAQPWDVPITKVTLSLFINNTILLIIILSVVHWYHKREQGAYAPGGFVGFMEMFIIMIHDDMIKSCVGPNHKKLAPCLLTAFFSVFINNIMGLIPILPGGASVIGNIAITLILALFTFVIVNTFGTGHYWKGVFWPDVPWQLEVSMPMMPFIEFFDVFTKPFTLMIRLFANILSGHMAILVLICLIFVSASMGPVINGSLTMASVLLNIFMNLLEALVTFVQAYVFTMLSAIFIGLAQESDKKEEVKE